MQVPNSWAHRRALATASAAASSGADSKTFRAVRRRTSPGRAISNTGTGANGASEWCVLQDCAHEVRSEVNHSYAAARPSGAPRVDRAVRLSDGRVVQIAEWGTPDGPPVVFLHGTPGSRVFCPDLAATERAGARLISFDRAGYGRSDPRGQPPTFRAAVADLIELLDELQIERAALIGFSGGGPHALACAALAGERVACVTTVCSSSGQIREADDDPLLVGLRRDVLADPVAARERVRELATTVLSDLTWTTRMTEQYNPQVFEAPHMRELYQRSWNEGSAVSVEGWVDDWIVRRRPYEFELSDIDVTVFVWFGEQDVLCPSWHADALVSSIRNSASFGCPDCRHYVPIGHWPEILDQSIAAHTG